MWGLAFYSHENTISFNSDEMLIVSIYNYTTHFDTPFMEYKHYFTN